MFAEQPTVKAIIADLWRGSSEEKRDDGRGRGWGGGSNPSALVLGLIFRHDRKLC